MASEYLVANASQMRQWHHTTTQVQGMMAFDQLDGSLEEKGCIPVGLQEVTLWVRNPRTGVFKGKR